MNIDLCIYEFKTRDYYRYLCSLAAPADKQMQIFAVYCFYLEISKIKDVIREPMAGYIRLQWWRDALQEISFSNKVIHHKHHITQLLCDSGVVKNVGFELFDKIISARETEIESSKIANLEALKQYAHGTEVTLCDILQKACFEKIDNELSTNVGIAYSFAMIMQSVRNNARQNHILLPLDMLQSVDVSEDEVLAGKKLEKTRIVIKNLTEIAQEHINTAQKSIKKLPKNDRNLFLPLIMADAALKNIHRYNYDIFTKDISPSKLKILFKLLINKHF